MTKIAAVMVAATMLTGCGSMIQGYDNAQREGRYRAALSDEVKAGRITKAQADMRAIEFKQRQDDALMQSASTYRAPVTCTRYSPYTTVCN